MMVALSISGILLLGARLVLEQIADSADRTSIEAETTDRIANAERVARGLVRRAEPADSLTPFTGNATETQFTSWCEAPGGWLERCAVHITISSPASAVQVATASLIRIELRTSAGDTIVPWDTRHATLAYVLDAEGGGKWTSSWSSSMTIPLAIGVLTGRDTTILPIGERR